MKRSVVLLLLITSVLLGCGKFTQPKRVERIISVDSWKVTHFFSGGENVTSQFEIGRLGFGDGGSLTILDVEGVTGSWNVSSSKPTKLYINSIQTAPFDLLNDDWEVTLCKKKEIQLESDNGSFIDKITLTKVVDEE